MPRTKVSRNSNKRSRGANDEKFQEFEITVDCYLNEIEENFQTTLTDIEMQINKLRSQLPGKALRMTMAAVRGIRAPTFADSPIINSSPGSFAASTRTSPASTVSKISDEGYLTHEETTQKIMQTPRMGPFMSAQKKNRRSRSAQGGIYTPQVNQLSVPANRTLVKRTQSALLGSRPSRPKFRTPMQQSRLKTCSVDRLMITPKVQPNTPMALLRHARTGECVFSVTGSPVITSVTGDRMANVNIPVGDSILSIRPTEMGAIDPAYISRIDKDTINHLKVLQQNLNKIMETASKVRVDHE